MKETFVSGPASDSGNTEKKCEQSSGPLMNQTLLSAVAAVMLAEGIPVAEAVAAPAREQATARRDFSKPFTLGVKTDMEVPHAIQEIHDPGLQKFLQMLGTYNTGGGETGRTRDILRFRGIQRITAAYSEAIMLRLMETLQSISGPSKTGEPLTAEAIARGRALELCSGGTDESLNEKLYALSDFIRSGQFDVARTVTGQLRELGYTRNLSLKELAPEKLSVLRDPKEQKAFVFLENQGSISLLIDKMVTDRVVKDSGDFYDRRPTEQLRLYIEYQGKSLSR